MNIIITMAGLGSRFRKAGYYCPKYMIEAKGKTLFDWSMDSLVGYNNNVNRYVFVVRAEDHAESFIREHCASYGIQDVKIVELDYLTDGQATTCMLAIPHCNADEAIMVYNIDTYVEPNEMRYKDLSGDGHIPCFHADGNHWSFTRLDDKATSSARVGASSSMLLRSERRYAFRITVRWELIIFHRPDFTGSCMRNFIPMTAKWRRMRSISHHCIIL